MAEERKNKIEEVAQNLRTNYGFSERQFGKGLFVASLALLVASVPATLTFQSAASDLDQLNREFDSVKGVMATQDFNESLQAINSLETTDIGPKFITASEAFMEAQSSLERAEEAQDDMENMRTIYQWLVLLSMVGAVAGLSILYV